jgi:FKBP-type peptidyl-prolyl cis-trans isomerase SlyD
MDRNSDFPILPSFFLLFHAGFSLSRIARAPSLRAMTTRRVVTFHYTLTDPAGRVLDTSAGGEPITYLEGAGQIIDGLDEQLRTVAAGVKTRVAVPAAKAYGAHDPAQVQRVPRGRLPVDGELKVGDTFQAGTDRHAPVVRIAAIEGAEVLLDANHPLAGVDLTFDVEITAARPATAEELRHGHAHGPAGNAHCD